MSKTIREQKTTGKKETKMAVKAIESIQRETQRSSSAGAGAALIQ
jgi:hypothetical protein